MGLKVSEIWTHPIYKTHIQLCATNVGLAQAKPISSKRTMMVHLNISKKEIVA